MEDGTLYYTGASYAEHFRGILNYHWDSVHLPSAPPPLHYDQEQMPLDWEDFLGASLTYTELDQRHVA
jgi:hypothetical protein